MSGQAYLVLTILAAAVLAFSFEWVAPEIVAVLVLVLLTALGILSPQESLSGFGSSAVIAIAALLVVGAGLVRSGVVKWMAERLNAWAGTGLNRLLLVSTLIPGVLSGFINIVAAVSIFIPAVLRLARRGRVSASRLLLPMAVSGLMGANLSLIGASHNLVVDGLLRRQTDTSFGFFEFAPLGLALVAGAILYSRLLYRLLPAGARDNGGGGRGALHDLIDTYHLNERLWEVQIQPESSACCRALEEIGPGGRYGLGVLMVLRNGRQFSIDSRHFEIQAGDVLALIGSRDRVEAMVGDHSGMQLLGQVEAEKEFTWSAFDLIEVAVPPRSPLIGRTLRDSGLRRDTGLTGIASWRGGRPFRSGVGDRRLRAGDGLLLFGTRSAVRVYQPEPDLLWVNRPREQEAPAHLRKYAPAAGLIFAAVIVSAALDWLSIAVAALAGAAAMILIGLLSPRRAYAEIDWRTLILIGGMYPMGTALEKTGAAAGLADLIVMGPGAWGMVPALAAVGLLSLLLTQPMHNAVAALIATPVALQVAAALNADPKAFALAVIVGASASFLMPVGHPAPLLVQRPGGYRNADYLKFGLGMTVYVLVVIAFGIPLLWPLTP